MNELRPIVKEALQFRQTATVREWCEFYEEAKKAMTQEKDPAALVREAREAADTAEDYMVLVRLIRRLADEAVHLQAISSINEEAYRDVQKSRASCASCGLSWPDHSETCGLWVKRSEVEKLTKERDECGTGGPGNKEKPIEAWNDRFDALGITVERDRLKQHLADAQRELEEAKRQSEAYERTCELLKSARRDFEAERSKTDELQKQFEIALDIAVKNYVDSWQPHSDKDPDFEKKARDDIRAEIARRSGEQSSPDANPSGEHPSPEIERRRKQ